MTNRAETLQAAYESSEWELVELRAAVLETCQAVEEGEAQAGSSLTSCLRVLGGHVSRRMRRVLHMGVQKALGVVRSHYEVNFEAMASGYIIPEGVEDEVAWSKQMHLPLMLPRRSPRPSRSSCSQTLLTPTRLRAEDRWALGPFFVWMLVSGPRGHVNNQVISWNLSTCKFKWCLFYLSRCSVSSFAWANSGWESSFFVGSPLGRRRERRVVSSRRRRLSLGRTSFPLGHPRPALVRSRLRSKHT
jgi:hypothetical protein